MVERVLATREEIQALEQILETQQRPDTFVERIFVEDQAVDSGSLGLA